jgi:hypothetical protein
MERPSVTVKAIRPQDADAVALFLHHNLNHKVSVAAWKRVIIPPWAAGDQPNHGFQLLVGGQVVGAYLAVYRDRDGDSGPVSVCNLAAFCVLEEFRPHGLKLMRALLAQKDYDFIDLSPSGNVIGLNERLGFKRLDTSTRLVLNLPSWPAREICVTDDSATLEATLRGRDAEIYQHHRGTAARHLLVQRSNTYAYLVFRRDRRKGVPIFASPIYVGGDQALLRQAWTHVRSFMLVRHLLLATLAERRILGFAHGLGIELSRPRPKMIRGNRRSPGKIDYLYSELALIEW